ncbi:Putative uncharacterized protein [Moritella viscosa]|uniref:Uncharacterized protein n=1 Tax=Moritella viscosa TaxID=80854 RepID=A0A1L0ARK3_9GAMM|nr:Putative uncharacterized protein [Moritella viscosa]SGY90642.1 Putative uncharacterized protein [Moritella viscosa]SGY90672.1 Putative uncharacterized protein [Moritella viscosa]SGY93309.1 Putative uncharacterized protein [Moritella viscosa]SGY93915.1 Putative uncharacterized protein [Moritella viscosa]
MVYDLVSTPYAIPKAMLRINNNLPISKMIILGTSYEGL